MGENDLLALRRLDISLDKYGNVLMGMSYDSFLWNIPIEELPRLVLTLPKDQAESVADQLLQAVGKPRSP